MMENGSESRDLKPPILIDAVIVSVTVLLLGLGVVMVYSTTGVISQEKFGDPFSFARRQAVAALVGLVAMYMASRINPDLLRKVSPYFLLLSLVLLILPLIPGVGDRAGGATRWLRLPFIRFQPGEIVKIGFVIFMAGFLGRHEGRLLSFQHGILKPFLMLGTVCGLFLLQPDFGSASVVSFVTIAMIASTGARLRYLGLGALALALGMGVMVITSPYRMGRIMSFLSPWADASGKGYQLIQSLIAVGTGQATGVGLGASQQKLFFLPAAHTDFIFAVISEELGFVGAVAVIALFLVFLWRGMTVAFRWSDDSFFFSLAVGLTMLIVVPALLNVGVVTGLLPTKGLVLPLVGYGGSSLVTSLVAIGLLLALERAGQKRGR